MISLSIGTCHNLSNFDNAVVDRLRHTKWLSRVKRYLFCRVVHTVKCVITCLQNWVYLAAPHLLKYFRVQRRSSILSYTNQLKISTLWGSKKKRFRLQHMQTLNVLYMQNRNSRFIGVIKSEFRLGRLRHNNLTLTRYHENQTHLQNNHNESTLRLN